MATEVTPSAMEIDDEAYVSSEDEDFDPSAVNADENLSSDSEDHGDTEASTKNKSNASTKNQKRHGNEEAEEVGFENSGDEATIKRAKDKAAKRKKKSDAAAGESSEGEGGFIMTRSMRAVQAKEKEKKPLASADGATIDVEALWKSMNTSGAAPIRRQPLEAKQDSAATDGPTDGKTTVEEQRAEVQTTKPSMQGDPSEMITVQIATMISGRLLHKPEIVQRSSEKAQRYLRTQQLPSRPLKRVSKWDPNPDGVIPPPSSTIGVKGRKGDKSKSDGPKMKKLNLVDKSHLDWVAHVAEMGDKEELEQAAKAKGGYLERADFLGRVEMNREEELRNARKK